MKTCPSLVPRYMLNINFLQPFNDIPFNVLSDFIYVLKWSVRLVKWWMGNDARFLAWQIWKQQVFPFDKEFSSVLQSELSLSSGVKQRLREKFRIEIFLINRTKTKKQTLLDYLHSCYRRNYTWAIKLQRSACKNISVNSYERMNTYIYVYTI